MNVEYKKKYSKYTCVTFHMSLTPTATATKPSLANSPSMQSRMLQLKLN